MIFEHRDINHEKNNEQSATDPNGNIETLKVVAQSITKAELVQRWT